MLPALFTPFLFNAFSFYFLWALFTSRRILNLPGAVFLHVFLHSLFLLHTLGLHNNTVHVHEKKRSYNKTRSHYGKPPLAIAPEKDRSPRQRRLSFMRLLQRINKTDYFDLSRTVTRRRKDSPHYFARNAVHFSTSRRAISHHFYWVASSFVVFFSSGRLRTRRAVQLLERQPAIHITAPLSQLRRKPGHIAGGKSGRTGVASTVSASRYSHWKGLGERFGAISGNTPDDACLAIGCRLSVVTPPKKTGSRSFPFLYSVLPASHRRPVISLSGRTARGRGCPQQNLRLQHAHRPVR